MTPRPWLLAALGCAVISIILVQRTGPAAFAADRDCEDFSTQREAQNLFEAHGGPANDPFQLDGDGDGRACESLPCPCASGGSGDGGGPQPGTHDKAEVIDIADGDTIKVRTRARVRDVRLIGIDTPEIYGGTECGGPEASAAMKRLLHEGDSVTLTSDPSQASVDRYGRLLRYVEHGGIDIGRKLVLRGRAHVYVYEGVRFARTSTYRKAQRRAKHANRGNWSNCGGRFRTADIVDSSNEAREARYSSCTGAPSTMPVPRDSDLNADGDGIGCAT